jgi:hypothetical protein
MGQLIEAHTGGMVDAETLDREGPQRLRDTMY